METLNTDKPPELVTNIEVMQIMEERIFSRKEEKKATKGGTTLRQRDWIENKVLEYLKSTPCVEADTERLPQLVKRLRGRSKEGFGLTNAETLQVLNFLPQEAVEIHLMIEELQTRLSEERQSELLKLISSFRKSSDEHAINTNTNGEVDNLEHSMDETDADLDPVDAEAFLDFSSSANNVKKEEYL